jgi:hypothetical protein
MEAENGGNQILDLHVLITLQQCCPASYFLIIALGRRRGESMFRNRSSARRKTPQRSKERSSWMKYSRYLVVSLA